MDLVRLAITRPTAVIAAVLMIVVFGLLALTTIPVQLSPDVRKPVITVRTDWRGGAPAEVERDIILRQEKVLKGIEGLTEMSSSAVDGRATINLEFRVGQDMGRALLLVSNRLNTVTGYPQEVEEPTLKTAAAEDTAIAWFILRRAPGNERPIHGYGDFAEDVVRDRLERVPGVADVNVYGGSEREIRVVVDPEKMARYRLTVPEVVDALRAANASVSAGYVDEGKRRYVVRSEGEFQTLDDIRAVVLVSEQDPATGRLARVTVGDVAKVRFDYKEPTARIRFMGEPAIAFGAIRETGANVIRTMEGIREAVADLNAGALPRATLTLEQVYDETLYIHSAIGLVRQNILIGGGLAVLVLLLFLRSLRATLVIALAIPVSVVGAFVAMAALGRSINVISLAGMAFAVGMVVDAAIVVLENIYRLRQQGLSAFEAAHRGVREVWGAVLVSVLTTVMVFIPILVMELEVGQLFRDIAVAISVSVLLSLLVAATLIPALARRLLVRSGGGRPPSLPLLEAGASWFQSAVLTFSRAVVRHRLRGLGVVGAVCGAAAVATYLFLPKLEYLPEGNRNLVFGVILPPPGYNLETTTGIAEQLEMAIRPLWASVTGPESAEGQPPKIARFFFVATPSRTFVGAAAVDPQRAGELIPVLREPVFREPGTFGFISQPSLFGHGIGGGRSIRLDISGSDLETILEVARRAVRLAGQVLPLDEGHQLRPIPGLELGAPEVRVVPDPVRLADNGVSARELGMSMDAFNSGLRVSEVTFGGRRIDLTLQGPDDVIRETQGVADLPVVTRVGRILPVAALADVVVTAGPTEIRRLERMRTVTLEIRPAPGVALETAIDAVRRGVIEPLEAEGLAPGIVLGLSGTADELSRTWDAMVVNLLVAIVIVYLVMAILLESFLYPLIIMLSVPLAAAGGVAGLMVLNLFTFQALDMLTLLGFVILVGIVVNNAILLVHQTLYLLREEGLEPEEAILEATRIRVRPIFMSTLTSVFGMLPLVVFPGAGSELYRGLGSVIVGGLALSALLTLAIIPPLLSLFLRLGERRRRPVPVEAGSHAAE